MLFDKIIFLMLFTDLKASFFISTTGRPLYSLGIITVNTFVSYFV